MRLFETDVSRTQKQMFDVARNGLIAAFNGVSSQFFYNIDAYLEAAPDTKVNSALRGRERILNIAAENGWKKAHELVEDLDPMYLAMFGNFENGVYVGADMEKEGYPTALFTRDWNYLLGMKERGMLTESTDLDKVKKALHTNKTQKAIKEGTFVLARLDFEGIVNGVPKFKAMIPRSNMAIGRGKRFVLIPVTMFYMFEDMVNEMWKNKPFKFTKTTVVGQITHKGTLSPDVVRMVYAGVDKDLIENKVKRLRVGYDVIRMRFVAYDLEGSIYGLGAVTFRPEMLDVFSNIDITEIDRSIHNIDFHILRGIFKTKVRALNNTQLDTVFSTWIDPNSYANMSDKLDAIFMLEGKKSDKELYHFMNTHKDIFGNLVESLEKREKVMPKFLKTMKPVELPDNSEERRKFVSSLLSKGVVRFTATKVNGSLMERVVTNNPTVLARMLGKDYVKTFETSPRAKLEYVKKLLQDGEVSTAQDLERVAVEYNILEYVDGFEPSKGVQNALDVIDAGISELQQIQESRTKNRAEHVNFRNVFPESREKFYGSVYTDNIISLEFAEV